MADYISRETALELIDNAPIIAGNENETLISAPKLSDEVYCIPAADVVPVEWVPVKERLPEPCFPVWAACKAADGRENWVIETSYIPNPQSKSQWGPVPILETGRATVYAWAERHPPEAPKEG